MNKILIIDDEPEFIDLFTKSFNGSPLISKVFRSTNEKDGWEIYIREKPEIVLLDINMPGSVDQYFLKKLKAEGITDAKVIVLSTFGDKDEIDKALELGAKGYITKGFSLVGLDKKILELIK